MTIKIKQGLEENIMLKVNPSDTLTELKKKFIEKGGKVDKYTKFIVNGRVVREDIPLRYQGMTTISGREIQGEAPYMAGN